MSLHDTVMGIFAAETIKMLGWTSPVDNLIPMDSLSDLGTPADNQTDYVYYLTTPADNPINRQIINDTIAADENGNTIRTIQMCRTLRCEWVIYGPNASDNADTIRLALLTNQTIHDDLAAQGISIVPDIAEPVFAPEEYNDQWYHRYDLSCDFNMLVTTAQSSGSITSASIEIISNEGVEGTCSV